MKTYVTPELTCRLFDGWAIISTSADVQFDAQYWLNAFSEGGN